MQPSALRGPLAVLRPELLLAFPHPSRGPPQRRVLQRGGLLLGLGELVFDLPFGDAAMTLGQADITMVGEVTTLRNLGGVAICRVNGQAVREQQELADGDVLRLGDTVLVFSSGTAASPAGQELVPVEARLTGVTPSIEAVRRSVDAVAPHPRTVVVTGETGTGKEIVARLLHHRSGRNGAFVAVNCGGFSEGLLASELFGHLRGAFTGAVAEQEGLFRAARGGTLLLDEASEIPLALQPILLRALETWEVRPVGSSRNVAVDVRVVAASNCELLSLVQRGLFRADLYARLAQWIIRLPPLRERRQDIPALIGELLGRLDAGDRDLTPDLEEALLIHPWPLNIRGLSNVLAIATIATPAGQPLALGAEVADALQDNRIDGDGPRPEQGPAQDLDRPALEALLGKFRGRVAEMARHVGVSRPKMYRLLWAVELDPALFRRT